MYVDDTLLWFPDKFGIHNIASELKKLELDLMAEGNVD